MLDNPLELITNWLKSQSREIQEDMTAMMLEFLHGIQKPIDDYPMRYSIIIPTALSLSLSSFGQSTCKTLTFFFR